MNLTDRASEVMYDSADTPFEIYVHASTLSTTGAAIPRLQNTRLQNTRLKNVSSSSHPLNSLPPSTLRKNGGTMGHSWSRPLPASATYPSAQDYVLPSTLSSSLGGKFSTSNLPSVLDAYVIQNRSNPGPQHYRIPEHKIQSVSLGKEPRAIFKRSASANLPGPGKYDLPPTSQRSGGVPFGKAFSIGSGKVINATTPGPGNYNIQGINNPTKNQGIKISVSNLPSEAEYIIRRNVPGPATYHPWKVSGESNKSTVGKFSTSHGPSELDRIILHAKTTPGPGEFHSNYLVNHGRRGLGGGSGRMSTAHPKSELDWIKIRAKQIPAPCDYNMKSSLVMDRRGHFSTSVLHSFIDVAVNQTKDMPGAGEYAHAPAGKDYTMTSSSSSGFILKNTAERFPEPRREVTIEHPLAHTFPSIPGRPGDKDSPAFTMGARYPAVIELNVSIHSPIRVQIPDAFGPQVRSDRPNRHGFSFNGGRGKDDMDGKIESPYRKSASSSDHPGPAKYDAFESFVKTCGKKDWSGKNAVKQANLKRARKNLWKWRRDLNF